MSWDWFSMTKLKERKKMLERYNIYVFLSSPSNITFLEFESKVNMGNSLVFQFFFGGGGIKKKVVGGLCKNAHANATSHVLEIRGSICEGFVTKGFETSYSDHLHHHISLHNTPIIPILCLFFLLLFGYYYCYLSIDLIL